MLQGPVLFRLGASSASQSASGRHHHHSPVSQETRVSGCWNFFWRALTLIYEFIYLQPLTKRAAESVGAALAFITRLTASNKHVFMKHLRVGRAKKCWDLLCVACWCMCETGVCVDVCVSSLLPCFHLGRCLPLIIVSGPWTSPTLPNMLVSRKNKKI